MRSLDKALLPRGNAFNLLRLVFAASVIAWHCIPLGGFTPVHRLAFGSDLGVDCFFIVSGFLITRSWDRGRSPIRFAWHRFLRIFPGFWACLIVAAGAGLVAWTHNHGTVASYFHAPHSPLDYIRANWHLTIGQTAISSTPAHVPYPRYWNTPLWTLHWEFECYAGIFVLGLLGLIRAGRRYVIGGLFAASYTLLVAVHFAPGVEQHLPGHIQGFGLRFASTFLAGAALYSYGHRIPASRRLAIAAAAVTVAALVFVRDYRIVALIPLAYLVIWLGGCNRGPRVTNRHDISYGVYIYGYIVQQLLATYGAYRLGYVPFLVFSLIATLPFAVASWLVIERRALRLKNWAPRRGLADDAAIPEAAQ